jgi:hypothetical protein
MNWSTDGCARPRTPRTATLGGVAMAVTPPELAAAMDRIDRAGRRDHPDSYAGLEVDQRLVRAVVWRVPSAAFDDVVRRAAADACVEVRDAPHGLAELTAWHDRIVADLPAWAEQGVRVSTVGARHDGAGVEVGAPDVEHARRALTARYGGAAPLVFVRQEPVTPFG